MAFGGRHAGRAARGLLALGLSLLVLFAQPAFAQQGNGEAGRVPVIGIPVSLSDDLKKVQREEPAPETLFEAKRQADRAAETVATFLQSEGYYQADVLSVAEGVDTFTRAVIVTPGPLFTYEARRIEYIGATPDETTQAELTSLLAPLTAGIPARAQPVIETGDALIARLRNAGYPDAKADNVDALADAKTQTIELTFRLHPGFRASFGKLSVAGLDVTKQEFIDRLKPWKPGEQYTPAKLDEFRSRLAETGLFDTAAVRLSPDEDTAPAAGDDAAGRDVIIELKERKRRTIAVGASASTSEGFGLDGEWELRNYSGWGDTLTVGAQLATLERRLKTTYRLPHIGRYGRTLELSGKIEDFETDAFDQSGASVSASLEERLTPRIRGSLGLEAGYASILDRQARVLGAGRRNLYILSGSATAEYVGVRDILEPVNGVRARVAVEPGLTYGDTTIAYARLSAEASIYSDFGADNFVCALRGRIGTIAGPNGAPPDHAFFAGGGGSVRGYEYQSLSPRDATGLTGGRSLVEMSIEARYRATDTLGYVAFLDAGAAGSNVEPPIDAMRAGAGVGVRYYTAFGPLRADFAVPLDKQKGDADFQIYISIGQAF